MTSLSPNQKGRRLLFQGKYIEAIKEFDKIIKIDPGNFKTWACRGSSKYSLKQYEEAIKDFDKAIEIDPKVPSYWVDRGFAHLGAIKYELAEKDFKKAYEINADEVNFNNNIGQIFYKKQNNYFAIKHYLKGLKIDPNNYEIYKNLSLAKL